MLSYNSRMKMFLFGCLGSKIVLVLSAKFVNKTHLLYMGYTALIPALGFAYIYITGSRKIGYEAGGKIWWNNLRPMHSVLYLLFAYNAILGHQNVAWKFLMGDFALGLIAFLHQHLYVLN